MAGKHGGRSRRLSADRAPTLRKQGVNRKWNGSVKGLGTYNAPLPPAGLRLLQQPSPTAPRVLTCEGSFPIQTNLTHSYCTTNGDILKDITMRIT